LKIENSLGIKLQNDFSYSVNQLFSYSVIKASFAPLDFPFAPLREKTKKQNT